MRISDLILPVALLSLGLGVTTAHALDGSKSPNNSIPEIPGVGPVVKPHSPPDVNPADSSSWFPRMQAGDIEGGVKAAEAAFHHGDVVAGWKLGRMYADGDGVAPDAARAFEFFHTIVENYRSEEVAGLRAQVIANAHVELGRYYLKGIPSISLKPDPVRAHMLFVSAANNFGDADAQYHLGRMLLEGQGVNKDPFQGARWLYRSANKGQYEAQAVFGSMLFQGYGQAVPRDAGQGLMWLRIAADTAPKGVQWIQDRYNAAWKQATEKERAETEVYYEKWKKSKSPSGVTNPLD